MKFGGYIRTPRKFRLPRYWPLISDADCEREEVRGLRRSPPGVIVRSEQRCLTRTTVCANPLE